MEETIELRELIEIILKGKWIIAIVTIICMLVAGVASWFVLVEKYESTAVVQVQVASNVQDTRRIMSSYVAAEFTPLVYTQRLKNESIINQAFQSENIENKFSGSNLNVTNEVNTNLVSMTYTSGSAENAQKELQTILSVTKSLMNTSIQDTLQDLESTYNSESTSLSKEIETIINEYNSIIRQNKLPEILILQTILNSEIILTITEDQTKAFANVSGEITK